MDLISVLYELWIYLVLICIGLPIFFVIRCMVEFHKYAFRQEYVRRHQLTCFPYD